MILEEFKTALKDRNTVNQLTQNNNYNLNDINQRNINQAIDNLSQETGVENIEFLLDTAENLKYGTNIDLGKSCYNDWKVKLTSAAQNSYSKTSGKDKHKLDDRFARINNLNKELSKDEKSILELRKIILSLINYKQLDKLKSDNIRNFRNNLDYFITSSESTTAQKLYILNKLAFLMSDDYEINPQLADKKTQVVAEIVNDLVINTPESKIPNTKAVNQHSHSICASISICRKNLAYEDKINFVDMIMSELDATDELQIYDISKLGSGQKISVPKTPLDFEYAMQKGYRIIDASACYWMNVADTVGPTNEPIAIYSAFDKKFFDSLSDSHRMVDFEEDLVPLQRYYETILTSNQKLRAIKTLIEKNKYIQDKKKLTNDENYEMISIYSDKVKNILSEESPTSSKDEITKIYSNLRKLQLKNSAEKTKVKPELRAFVFIEQEPEKDKIEKIAKYITTNLEVNESEDFKNNVKTILTLLSDITHLEAQVNTGNKQSTEFYRGKSLFEAASAFRTQMDFKLNIPEYLSEEMIKHDIPDRESLLVKNIDKLIVSILNGSMKPEIKNELTARFSEVEITDDLIEALSNFRLLLSHDIPLTIDELYRKSLLPTRREILLAEVSAHKQILESDDNNSSNKIYKDLLNKMDINVSKDKLINILNDYINILSNEELPEDEYVEIYNKLGHKNHMLDFKNYFSNVYPILFTDNPDREEALAEFKRINGLDDNATEQEVYETYKAIADSFDNLSLFTSNLQDVLKIEDDKHNILNSPLPKDAVMKQLEKERKIIKHSDLLRLFDKFTAVSLALSDPNGENIRLKDLPKEMYLFDKTEKDILKQISKNINTWYSISNKEFDTTYKQLKEPLSEYARSSGMKIGADWYHIGNHSGLTSQQEVRIIEQMTDRPYYIEQNIKRAVEKIKNSPYSGISSSSVSHISPGLHAQYIADIKPYISKTEDGKIIIDDIILHDNSWGALESSNVWIDESGLMRTDYNSGYGGDIGYITDGKYRNGNLVSNVISKVGETIPTSIESKNYKRYTKTSDLKSYRYSLYPDIITPGIYPMSNEMVKSLRDTIFEQSTYSFNDFISQAKNMTKEEILDVINKYETLGLSIYKQMSIIEKRVFGNPPFDKGIVTKEDYDALDDNDTLKILFDKLALKESYRVIPEHRYVNSKSTREDLNKIQQLIQKEAEDDFYYFFGKSNTITKFLANSSSNDLKKLLIDFNDEFKLSLSEDNISKIIHKVNELNIKEYSGNVKTIIDLMGETLLQNLWKTTKIKGVPYSKIDDVIEKYKEILQSKVKFTSEDLKYLQQNEERYSNIIDWIDLIFNPKTDEEFVEIVNELRNMDISVFNSQYQDSINSKALGITSITGYDILQKYRTQREDIDDKILNQLYYEEFMSEVQSSKTKPIYEYSKFGRLKRGASYIGKRNFEDLYFDYRNSLSSLNLKDRYKHLIDDGVKKYDVFPVYPVIEYEDTKVSNECVDKFYLEISKKVDLIKTYSVIADTMKNIKNLQRYITKISNNNEFTIRQKEHVKRVLKKFYEENKDDSTLININNLILEILNEPIENMTIEECKKTVNLVYSILNLSVKNFTGSSIENAIAEKFQQINQSKHNFVSMLFATKFQSGANEIINKMLSALIKNSADVDNYCEELKRYYDKNKMIKKPPAILNEFLMMICNNGNKNKETNSNSEFYNSIKETYKTNLSNLLALSSYISLQYLLKFCNENSSMNVVKNDFKNSRLEMSDGSSVSLDSPLAICIILSKILSINDAKLASIYINELGLGEAVIEAITKDLELKEAYNILRRITTLLSSTENQLSSACKQLEIFRNTNLNKDCVTINEINEFKTLLLSKLNTKKYIFVRETFDDVFSSLVRNLSSDSTINISQVFQYFEIAQSVISSKTQLQIQEINSEFSKFNNTAELLSLINLPQGSILDERRKKYFESYNNFIVESNSISKFYPLLGLRI